MKYEKVDIFLDKVDLLAPADKRTRLHKFLDWIYGKIYNPIPKCKGFASHTPDGTEYDCAYDPECACDECICVTAGEYHDYGGIDPRDSQKFKKWRWQHNPKYTKRELKRMREEEE